MKINYEVNTQMRYQNYNHLPQIFCGGIFEEWVLYEIKLPWLNVILCKDFKPLQN